MNISRNEWAYYLEAATREKLYIDPGVYNSAFLGAPTQNGTFLTQTMKEELAKMKIPTLGQYYSHGLISVRLHKDNIRYNLIHLEQYLRNKVNSNPWLQETVLAAQLIQLLLRIRFKTNRIEEIVLLLNERDFIYSQIACYCLPPAFLKQIINPCLFVEDTAPDLGRYLHG